MTYVQLLLFLEVSPSVLLTHSKTAGKAAQASCNSVDTMPLSSCFFSGLFPLLHAILSVLLFWPLVAKRVAKRMWYSNEQSSLFLWWLGESVPATVGCWSGYTVKKCPLYSSSPPAPWTQRDLGEASEGWEVAADAAGKGLWGVLWFLEHPWWDGVWWRAAEQPGDVSSAVCIMERWELAMGVRRKKRLLLLV